MMAATIFTSPRRDFAGSGAISGACSSCSGASSSIHTRSDSRTTTFELVARLEERHDGRPLQRWESSSDLAGKGTATRASAQSFANALVTRSDPASEPPIVADAPGTANIDAPGGSGVKKIDG